ncbi:MAG: 2-hydroxy-3-oxopropionate reductase [Methylobacter sp.]|nr:MAG: 2-hydroxy-3-oxopropionate reductase [Methylobacter sp.]
MNKKNYTLGFIGIGLMGLPMTLRLLKAGYRVHSWNRTPDKLTPAVAAGALACESIAALVAASDIILLCLADSEAVAQVVTCHILPQGRPGQLVLDLSSIRPETTRELAAALDRHCGMRWVDAPVSGGVAGAEQGTLAIMAGGTDSDIAVAREVLAPLYRQLTHMGPVGSGQLTKICNQMIVSCNVMVIAEMMALAAQAGVDASRIPEALAGGFADSKPLQITAPLMASGTFEPVKWRVKTLLKDLNMAVETGKQLGSAIPLSALAAQLMQVHGSHGFLEHDPATLIKLYQSHHVEI